MRDERVEMPEEFRTAGVMRLDSSDFALSSRMLPRDVEQLPGGAVKRIHHGGDETHITLTPQAIRGVNFHVNLRFCDGRLRLIELMACNESVPEVMAAGAAWTQENEMARKRFHEAWAENNLGCPLAIKPWIDPDLPEPVMPAFPGPDHPHYAAFEWGEIGSYFDGKGCAALLIVSYEQ